MKKRSDETTAEDLDGLIEEITTDAYVDVQEVVRETAWHIARVFGSLVNIFNPDVVVIAGGFLLAQIFFGDKLALRSMGAHVTEPDERV